MDPLTGWVKALRADCESALPLNRWGGCRPPPYPRAASVRCLSWSTFSGGWSIKDMIIGVDLAKRIFRCMARPLRVTLSTGKSLAESSFAHS